jgi:hypothetical protein
MYQVAGRPIATGSSCTIWWPTLRVQFGTGEQWSYACTRAAERPICARRAWVSAWLAVRRNVWMAQTDRLTHKDGELIASPKQ